MTYLDPSKKWTHPVPAWVSRPDSDGMISAFTLPLWLFLIVGVLVLLNMVGWGVVGLVELVQYILPS